MCQFSASFVNLVPETKRVIPNLLCSQNINVKVTVIFMVTARYRKGPLSQKSME